MFAFHVYGGVLFDTFSVQKDILDLDVFYFANIASTLPICGLDIGQRKLAQSEWVLVIDTEELPNLDVKVADGDIAHH